MKKFLTLAVMLVALLFLPMQASAEGHRAPMDTDAGRPLTVLMHDQIPVIAKHFNQIIALGDKALAENVLQGEARAALADYLAFAVKENRQSAYGFVPGTATYDFVPYHKPYHAALRSAFHVLDTLNKHAGSNAAVRQLYDTVNDEMVGLMSTCVYTFDDITTASVVTPDWGSLRNLANHPLERKIAIGGAAGLILLLGFVNLSYFTRRSARA